MQAAAPKLQLYEHYGLKSEHRTATFRKFRGLHKRRPKDRWNGLILKYCSEIARIARRPRVSKGY